MPDEPTTNYNWKSAKFQAGLPTMVKNAGDRLKDNGSNYADWEYQVVFSIINLSVPADVGRWLSGSARSAMATIWSLFFFPSHSAHITAWKEAHDHKLTEGMDVGTYLRKMDMMAMDLEHTGFKWTKDSMLGMWYQLGLPSSYANVSTVLNAHFRAQPDRPVSAHEVEEAIQAENQEHGTPGSSTLASFNAIDLNATQGNHPPFT
ncbi:hypothetical protein CROQUDRAFT_101359 [Cronartium quercuum f. sp. fusiforme G11]|uniref:Uncharacterized protein n=1 Tax=Cronartium quercuum f. sp. fusiforme G11 TaxID=708437 RepID=A0A9P6T576_9BASI|nr:hypothetical protein CROQUDRAFT_101359 [Cronartium quercuum f. sp. fusiforme G11]